MLKKDFQDFNVVVHVVCCLNCEIIFVPGINFWKILVHRSPQIFWCLPWKLTQRIIVFWNYWIIRITNPQNFDLVKNFCLKIENASIFMTSRPRNNKNFWKRKIMRIKLLLSIKVNMTMISQEISINDK